MRCMLKSKIHRATLTGADLNYVGSISIPPELMRLADIVENEKVLVANLANGNRFETYAIPGEPDQILLNGAAAHLGKAGDLVIIMAWSWMDDSAIVPPQIVHVDGQNRPKSVYAQNSSGSDLNQGVTSESVLGNQPPTDSGRA